MPRGTGIRQYKAVSGRNPVRITRSELETLPPELQAATRLANRDRKAKKKAEKLAEQAREQMLLKATQVQFLDTQQDIIGHTEVIEQLQLEQEQLEEQLVPLSEVESLIKNANRRLNTAIKRSIDGKTHAIRDKANRKIKDENKTLAELEVRKNNLEALHKQSIDKRKKNISAIAKQRNHRKEEQQKLARLKKSLRK